MCSRTAPASMLFVILMFTAAVAFAYPNASGCRDCHPDFEGGPGNATHDLHVGASQMTTNCNLCHTNSGDTPDINDSPEGGSCTGCHLPRGLWQRHQANSISCSPCHSGWSTPDPEDTAPPYYGRNDVALTDPCETNTAVGGEDWDGDGKGLDNDGDTFYDADDTDCAPTPVEQATWSLVKALYED